MVDVECPPGEGIEEQPESLARRKVLRVVSYAAPLVIGTFFSRTAAAASCGPNNSCPPDSACKPECFPKQ